MELAEFAIRIDSRDAKNAEADLKRLADTGTHTERSLEGVGEGGKEAARGSDAAARSSREAAAAMDRHAEAARRVTSAVRYFAAASVAAGAAAATWMLSMSRSMDATQKMAEQIGVTTEALTGMRFAAQQFANISDQTFDMSMRRMTRRIEEAAQGGGAAKAAIEGLGFSAKELARLSPDRQMLAIADAMQRTESQARRLQYAMAIFDTEGMPLVAALQQGSAAFEENIRLAQRYGVVLSTEAAQAAADFQTEVSRLHAIVSGFSLDIANQVLPTLNRFINNAIEAATKVDGLHSEVKELTRDSAFKDWFDASLVGLARVADVAVAVAKSIGVVGLAFKAAAADVQAGLAWLAKPNAADKLLMPAEEYQRLVDEYDAAMSHQKNTVERFNAALDNLLNYQGNRFEQAAIRAINTITVTSDKITTVDLTVGGDSAGASEEQLKKLAEWTERLATPTEKLEMTLARAKAELGSLYTPEIERRIRAQYAAQQSGNKVLTEAQRIQQAFERERQQSLRTQRAAISAIHEEARGIEDQVALYGLSRTAIEDLTIARLEEQAALLSGRAGAEEQLEIFEREIEARKRLRAAIGSMEQKEAERAAWESWSRDVEQIFNQVGQSLTDALFEGGKSARDLIKDLFKTLTLRVVIQPMLSGLQGMVTNQLGGLMGYQDPRQQGGFGGISNALSTYNNLNTLAGGVSQWMTGASVGASNLSLGYANTVGMFGGDSIGALISANGGWEQALSGLSSATSAAVTAGALSAAPTVAASLSTSFGTAATTMASTSFTASLGGGAAAASGGAAAAGGAGGLMSGIAAAGPWIAGGLAVASLLGGGLFDREPTTRREQRTQVEYADGLLDITKRDDRVQAGADQAVAQMTAAAIDSANSLFQQIGVDATIDSFHAIMASSYAGDRDGVASGGALRIGDELRKFGIAVDDENPTIQGFGGWSSADTLPRLATDIQLSVLEAFQSVSDELPNVLAGMLEGIDIRSLGEQEAQALAERFTLLTQGASQFLAAIDAMPFAELRDLSFDAAAGMVQFAGGLENLVASQQTYYERFYSDAERHAHSVDQLTQALAGVGVEMPALVGSTDDMLASYRALVESLDLNTEAGQQAYVTLMQTAGAFADVAQFAGQAAVESQRLADQQRQAMQALRQSFVGLAGDALAAIQQHGQERIAKLSESFARTDAVFNAYRTQVQQLESQWGSLITTMQRSMRDLRGQVEEAARLQYNQARAVISTALLTGKLPQTADLGEAIRVAQQGVTGGRYASEFDQREAYLKLANELEALQGIAQPELDAARASLKQLEKQYNRLRGIEDLSGLSLKQLEKQLGVALSAEAAARTQIAQIEQQIALAQLQYQQLVGINDELSTLPGALKALAKAIDAASRVPAESTAVNREARYLANNPDVLAAYVRGDWGVQTAEEAARYHWEKYGKYEGRQFARGGYYPGGLALVGEEGPELINFARPGQVYRADQTQDILRQLNRPQGDNTAALERRIDELIRVVEYQNQHIREINKSSKRTANNTEDTAAAIAHGDSDGGVVVVM